MMATGRAPATTPTGDLIASCACGRHLVDVPPYVIRAGLTLPCSGRDCRVIFLRLTRERLAAGETFSVRRVLDLARRRGVLS